MVKQKRTGGAWYYEFMYRGKRYYGTCEGAASKREAEAFEKAVREKAAQAAGLKSVKALYETFREDLTGGKKIGLDEAFELSLKKPRKRTPAEKKLSLKRGVWRDFLAFMHGEHPEILFLADVQKKHAEEYIARLRDSGKYDKAIQYKRPGNGRRSEQTVSYRTREDEALSPRTINFYQVTCAEVFTLLKEDAGIQDNPFASILKLDVTDETREAFTPDELKTIFDNLDGFTRPLFVMAIWTGLREGDICALKWGDVDLDRRLITRKTRKTGAVVQIPISDQLYSLLSSTPRAEGSDYVFPKHAEMYLKNPDGVSYRVKKYLEGLGIQTTRKPDGRTRAISTKDLHSCRHTFCYYAGLAGIPLSVVQAIVGHMSPAMTAHYSAHASIEDKRRGMRRLSFAPAALPEHEEEPERAEARRLIGTMPLDELRAPSPGSKSRAVSSREGGEMTKRPNDETPAPDDWLSTPNNAQAERAERVEVLRRLASRLYSSYLTTPELAALLDESKAPLWAFEILPHLAQKERPFRERDKKALSFEDLNAAIDQLFDELKRPPTQKEVCALLGEQRGVEADGTRGTISRLLNRRGKMIWDPVMETHEPDSIDETDGMKFSEYIKWRTSPDEILLRKNPEEWEKRRMQAFFALLDKKDKG